MTTASSLPQHSAHVSEEDAAGLVMLDPNDTERRAAEAHAQNCPACARVLADARRLLDVLADVTGEPGVSVPPDDVASAAHLDAMVARLEPAVGVTFWQRGGAMGASLFILASSLVMAWLMRGDIGDGIGLKCALLELAGAASVFVLAFGIARRASVAMTRPLGAGVAAMGAFATEIWLSVACPDHHDAHLLIFHVGAVALAIVLGALAGDRASRLPVGG